MKTASQFHINANPVQIAAALFVFADKANNDSGLLKTLVADHHPNKELINQLSEKVYVLNTAMPFYRSLADSLKQYPENEVISVSLVLFHACAKVLEELTAEFKQQGLPF